MLCLGVQNFIYFSYSNFCQCILINFHSLKLHLQKVIISPTLPLHISSCFIITLSFPFTLLPERLTVVVRYVRLHLDSLPLPVDLFRINLPLQPLPSLWHNLCALSLFTHINLIIMLYLIYSVSAECWYAYRRSLRLSSITITFHSSPVA